MKYRSSSYADVERSTNYYDVARTGGSRHAGWGYARYDLTSYARMGVVALLITLMAWALLATRVAAHAVMVRSDPESGEVREQAPEQVVAWFSEELDTSLSTMQVLDADGHQVDDGDGDVDLNDPDHVSMTVSLPGSLPGGVYTVHWTAVSAEDDDATEGEFAFVVGDGAVVEEPAPMPDAGTGLNAGLLIGAVLAVLGLLLAGFVLARRRAAA